MIGTAALLPSIPATAAAPPRARRPVGVGRTATTATNRPPLPTPLRFLPNATVSSTLGCGGALLLILNSSNILRALPMRGRCTLIQPPTLLRRCLWPLHQRPQRRRRGVARRAILTFITSTPAISGSWRLSNSRSGRHSSSNEEEEAAETT